MARETCSYALGAVTRAHQEPSPDSTICSVRGAGCGLRVSVETYMAPKASLQCKRCQRFGHTQRNCGYAPRCLAYDVTPLCSTPKQQFKCCRCEAKAALAKRGPTERRQAYGAAGRHAAPEKSTTGPSAEQESRTRLEPCRPRGLVVKATLSSEPQPTPRSITEPHKRAQLTESSKMGKTTQLAPKVTEAPKQATVTKQEKGEY